MKKKSLLNVLFGGLLISVGLSSCKKCQTCTYTVGSSGYTEEVCQSEFGTKSLYKAYISYLESIGYNCK